MKNVCIFGDSIAWGASDTEEGGWVQRLKKYIQENGFQYEVYNLGICGNTSTDLLLRFDTEAKARNPQIIIFAIGTNDLAFIKTQDNVITPLPQYISNINKLIEKARLYTHQIVLIGLPRVDASKTNPYPESSTGKCYINENIKKYSDVLKECAQQYTIPFVDVFEVLTTENLADGLHPNSLGHEKLFNTIKNDLFKKKVLI